MNTRVNAVYGLKRVSDGYISIVTFYSREKAEKMALTMERDNKGKWEVIPFVVW